MASFCKVSIIAFFLLASGAFLSSPALAFQANEQDFNLAPEPSSSSDQDIIPPALRRYLFQCLKKEGEECSLLFFARIFIGEKNEIPTSCCQDLVQMGDKCHTAITNAVISTPEFSDNATLFRTRSDETWTTCSRLVETISPRPSA
ncbi:hypothetical protein PVL29_020762 [Vitis rotundifolia]|uniref:Prolamin-like domain-containing protein n=1 Tax=Vitis rotundifolia TaxID=103349 RepID=A0AA38YYC3_VITRO|nr:hypothetical protein PVL29_020762 [Vitis rotundifolia]